MIGAVVNLAAAVPIVMVHASAALPLFVLNVMLLLGMIVPVVVLLSYGREGRAADAKEDACGDSFIEQVM